MPLFSKSLVHPKTGKKLQVYVDGCRVQLIRISGVPGATAEDEVVQLKTEEAAQQTANRFIEAQLARGFVDAADEPKSEALDSALENADAQEALAKLQQRGTPDDVKAFVTAKADALFGSLAKRLDYEFFDLEWKDGLVDAITLDADEELGTDLAALTSKLLALPVCSRVRRLRFAVPGASKHGPLDDWTATFAAVTAAPCAGALESLGLDFTWDEHTPPLDSITIGDLSRGWPALKKLKTLSLRGQELKLGGAKLPSLETLRWECARLGPKDCDQLLAAKMPRLESLELTGGPLTESVAKRLIEGLDAFPALTRFEADMSRLSAGTRQALASSTAKKTPSKKRAKASEPKRRRPPN